MSDFAVLKEVPRKLLIRKRKRNLLEQNQKNSVDVEETVNRVTE